MEKVNKFNKRVEQKEILNYAKKALSIGVALSPVIGICAGCSSKTEEATPTTTQLANTNNTAVIIEDNSAIIIDYTEKDYYWYNMYIDSHTWVIKTTTGETLEYVISDKSSIIFISDENAHDLAIAYAKSIVGDNYTEYNTEEARKRG